MWHIHARQLLDRLEAELARPAGAARMSRADLQALVKLGRRSLGMLRFQNHLDTCATRGGAGARCTCGYADELEKHNVPG